MRAIGVHVIFLYYITNEFFTSHRSRKQNVGIMNIIMKIINLSFQCSNCDENLLIQETTFIGRRAGSRADPMLITAPMPNVNTQMPFLSL